MSRAWVNAGAAGSLLAILSGAPLPAAAQEEGWVTIQGHGGVSLPAGDLAKLSDLGPTFGGGLAFWFHPNFALRGDVDVGLLDRSDDETGEFRTASMDLLHLSAGFEIAFDRWGDQSEPLDFRLNVTAGSTNLKADESELGTEFDQSFFTLTGGVTVGYDLGRVTLFAAGRFHWILVDEEDLDIFLVNPTVTPALDAVFVVPLTAGLRVSL